MKTCPICQAVLPTKAALATHMLTHQGKRSKRRSARSRNTGVNTVSLKEYWGSVDKSAGTVTIDCKPSKSKLPKLATIATVYEQYRLLSYTVHFVHTASSNTSGSYFVGVSFGTKHPTDDKGIASLSPSFCKSVTSDSTITVPCARMMAQPWLDTTHDSPGVVLINTDFKLEVWVTYRVMFSGPTNVAQSDVIDWTYQTDGHTWKNADTGDTVTTINVGSEVYAELELNAPANYADGVWNALKKAWTTAQSLHRAWQDNIGLIHFLGSATAALTLPALGVPAIMHLQQRPFRASNDQWRRVTGDIAVKGPD
uniref:Orf1 n=4 Tax=Craigies Hill virus TaxID=1654362 RepID=A0A2Z4QKX0_9VIRU|nr:orf1 [Craigies Hill virus]AWY11155.1 orf1 [Craigies Hill virus]AWY11158.1 orf1 [Craigies Hill virus]AWY11170.1 orf1 [Craigies Hill virus]AWY11192.1 orf1 [Craigies Hill virus]